MDAEGARFQTLEQLHERRKQVVRLHRKGIGVMRIVALSGLSYPAVRGVMDRHERDGVKTIKPAARGKRSGEGRRHCPAGKTSVVYTVGGTRQKLSMIAAATNRGKARWMIIDEAFNADRLIEFLASLIKDADK